VRALLRVPPLLLLGLACAGAPPALPPGTGAAPALGDPLGLLLAKLAHAEGAPAEIEVRELRMIDVAQEPWRSLDADAARDHAGPLGVIAGRRCAWRDGWSRSETLRGSWYLLRDGRLAAFDHRGFAGACAERPAFRPAAPAEVALERSLSRYLSQRYPPGEIPGEQRLARGLALLESGRTDEAVYELHALDRRIDELSRRQSEYETPDADAREQLAREEEALRPLRAQLQRALAEHDHREDELP
jgi:hypothetical protein